MKKISTKKILGITVSLVLISGCSHQYMPMPDDPRFAPLMPDMPAEVTAKNGATYVADTGLSLYQDMKAHRIGDIITVQLVESTKASKDAKTNFKKEYDNSTTNPLLFGNNPKFDFSKIPFIKNFITSDKDRSLQQTVSSATEFKGTGDSGQNNSLNGNITVTVVKILPNKNLFIRGEKWITLNQGSEYIRLTGIVRPQDIGPNNEVLSNRIADARITYSGTGAVANANTPGWLSKFFNSPFYPF